MRFPTLFKVWVDDARNGVIDARDEQHALTRAKRLHRGHAVRVEPAESAPANNEVPSELREMLKL